MIARVGIILATASAAMVAGCCDELAGPPVTPGVYVAARATQLATVGAPGPQDMPFGEALVTYSHELGELRASEKERTDAGIREAIFRLATALERAPAGPAQPSLRGGAASMRRELEQEGAEPQRRALAVAATEIDRLASSLYHASPEVGAAARAFAGAVEAIDVKREPPDRAGVINALVRAERALQAIYVVNAGQAPPAD